MKKIILFSLVFILMASIVSAITIDIDVKPSFKENEKLQFSYTITSNKDETITYTPIIICKESPIALLQELTTDLKANQPFTSTYYDKIIDESIDQQYCDAILQIIEPEKITEKKLFKIDVKPKIYTKVLTCKDPNCNYPTRVFVKGETIYTKVITTDKYGREIAVQLEGKKKRKEIDFVNKKTEFTADKKGSYEIEITVSKPDYKTVKEKADFAVINKNAEIKTFDKKQILKKGKLKKGAKGVVGFKGEGEKENILEKIVSFFKDLF